MQPIIISGARLLRANNMPYYFFSLLKVSQKALVEEMAALLPDCEHMVFDNLPGPVEPEIAYAFPQGKIKYLAARASDALREQIDSWKSLIASAVPAGADKVPDEWLLTPSQMLPLIASGTRQRVINCQTQEIATFCKGEVGWTPDIPAASAWRFWCRVS